ncbi:MAG: hypothetical protein WBZ29_05145, partial [Methanocella sp.]
MVVGALTDNIVGTAASSMIGYLYQSQYALYSLLNCESQDIEISIEKFDDISFEFNGSPRELIQTKCRCNSAGSLSDRSIDLWKTIRNWSKNLKSNNIRLPGIYLTLITTSAASED